MSFGVKQYSYFTYWSKQMNSTKGEFFPDGEAIMNRKGEKTKMYKYVQKVNTELNKLAPLLWDFEYCSNAYFVKPPLYSNPTYLELVRGGELTQVTDVTTDKEEVLVTELYDKKRAQYMICATNITDPKRYRKHYKYEKQNTELTFAEGYNVADIYFKGKWKTVDLENGKLQVSLYSGEGVIVLPYRK